MTMSEQATVTVVVSKDEDGFFIDECLLEDNLRELLDEVGQPEPYVVDAGIGPYEYWGCRGWDSDVCVDEVTGEPVEVKLGFQFKGVDPTDQERAVGEVLDLCNPTVHDSHSAEGAGDYDVKWEGELNRETRIVIYKVSQA
jgi:hypothetical protein